MTGSIISGTHRIQDLVPVFLSELQARESNVTFDIEEVHYLHRILEGANGEGEYNLFISDTEGDAVSELLDKLYNALDDVSPPGHYFGANEGDGADFGYWPLWDEDEDA